MNSVWGYGHDWFKSKVTDSLEMKGANKTLFSVRIVFVKMHYVVDINKS